MIHRHLLAVSLIVLLFPAVLPPAVTIVGGVCMGVGFWLWLRHRVTA